MGRGPQRSDQRAPMRRRMMYRTSEHMYEFDQRLIPEGITYQWMRHTLLGEEDKTNAVVMDHNGWEPVPADRHPELAGRKAVTGQTIVRGGLILCELPTEYVDEAKEYRNDLAVQQVASQARKLRLDNAIGGRMKLQKAYAPESSPQYDEEIL